MGHKLKQGRKDNSRVLGLSSMKVKSCRLGEALPDCFALPVLLRADPRSSRMLGYVLYVHPGGTVLGEKHGA